MTELNQPHDRFFRKTFQNMNIVEDILVNNIPEMADLIVPGSLENVSDQFVDTKLKRYISDLLIKARLITGDCSYFYFLLEHKSFYEPRVAFDVMKYMLQVWDTENTEPMPFIFPVVIYHGHRSWNRNTILLLW